MPERQEIIRKDDQTNSLIDPEKTYDYVFIGAGATGGTAAARLVENFAKAEDLRKKGFSVLVLEGGVDKPVLSSQIPVEHARTSEDPDVLSDPNRTGKGSGYWVRHFDDLKEALKDPKARREDGMVWKPRGEGFGGSTRMNANFFIRIDDKDWDDIAERTGDPAFRAKNMRPILEDLTKTEYRPILSALNSLGKMTGIDSLRNLGGHGFDGPIALSRANPTLLLKDPLLTEIASKGLLWSSTHLGSPLEKAKRLMSAYDPNDNLAQNTEGPVLVPMSVSANGRRVGARDMLLDAQKKFPNQLTLQDGARVSQILLDNKNKVTGVLYTDPEGKPHRVNVAKEAIVATGALESAALLMRSGIGPKSELNKLNTFGVKPQVLLDGVGQKQGFRYEVAVVERLNKPFSFLKDLQGPLKPGDPLYEEWKAGKGGLAATNGAFLAWQSRSRPDLKEPDLFVFAVPGNFEGYKPGYSKDAVADPNMVSFVILNKHKGESNGTLELDPKNPTGAPLINHHFHGKPEDAAPLVAGIKQVRSFVSSQLGDLQPTEVWPGKDNKTDAQLADKVVHESWDHHPRGGAQIGDASDPSTVVDGDFKVVGTTGLRVIDASVLPNNIGDFIVSGLYQIGDLAAKKIAADANKPAKSSEYANTDSLLLANAPTTLVAAEALVRKSADQAKAQGLISKSEHKKLSKGSVSESDIDVAWTAIEDALKNGGERGSQKHTAAHNLLLSVRWHLNQQEKPQPKVEKSISVQPTAVPKPPALSAR